MDNTFDDSKIEPAAPEWKVYFEGNFWGHWGRGRAGTEIRLDQQFDWAGHHWVIPAVYSCGKGLVVDLCMRTEAKDIRRLDGNSFELTKAATAGVIVPQFAE